MKKISYFWQWKSAKIVKQEIQKKPQIRTKSCFDFIVELSNKI